MAKRHSRCGRHSRRRKRRRRRMRVNGFILFYLRVLKCMPKKSVVKVAQIAGEKWRCMPEKEKCKYINMSRRKRR